MEFEFLVKVEGYKEKTYTYYGNNVDEAKDRLQSDLYEYGLCDILYIIEI